MANGLKPGDRVISVEQKNPMVVQNVDDGIVQCFWFDDQELYRSQEFNVEDLKKCEKEVRTQENHKKNVIEPLKFVVM